ncbi:MAG: hypothetical protein Q9227_004953 [Pyrenula ochraceoflavens]
MKSARCGGWVLARIIEPRYEANDWRGHQLQSLQVADLSSALPLAVAAPASAAILAYLNARWSVHTDLSLLAALVGSRIQLALMERKDKVNIFYTLEEHAHHKHISSREFLIYDGKAWTFRQVYDETLKWASWLRNVHDVKPREIVAMDFMNSERFVFLWMALWSLGATPAFINYNLTGKPLIHSVKVSTARLLFVDPEIQFQITPEVAKEFSSSNFSQGKEPLQTVFLDTNAELQIATSTPYRAPDSARAGAKRTSLAVLIYTSGTTGLPKPAVVSWAKARIGGFFVSSWARINPRKDRFYTCMPLYHSSGAVLGLGTCLISGTPLVLGHRFSTKKFWEEVRSNRATIIQYVGETLRYLLATPPLTDPVTGQNLDKENDVRMAFGNGLRPDVWDKFKRRFNVETIAEFYSATEGTSGSWNLSSNDFSKGAIGRNGTLAGLLLGSTVTIVEVDMETEQPWRDPGTGFCKVAERGEPGEVLYRLDPDDINDKFQGYFNNDQATEGKIMRDVLSKGDAWFRSGDLLRWDSEGRWYFSDRIGDTFRWKGENVSTAEVSEVMGHHPMIHEANVYGVSLPHHDGRAGCAAVVFDPSAGSPYPSQDALDSVATFTTNSLPKYAVPLFLRVVKEMQATGNNKQQKHVLRTEGVDLEKIKDQMFWLKGVKYVPFKRKDWKGLLEGQARL